jgi:hypothetical protein
MDEDEDEKEEQQEKEKVIIEQIQKQMEFHWNQALEKCKTLDETIWKTQYLELRVASDDPGMKNIFMMTSDQVNLPASQDHRKEHLFNWRISEKKHLERKRKPVPKESPKKTINKEYKKQNKRKRKRRWKKKQQQQQEQQQQKQRRRPQFLKISNQLQQHCTGLMDFQYRLNKKKSYGGGQKAATAEAVLSTLEFGVNSEAYLADVKKCFEHWNDLSTFYGQKFFSSWEF